MKHRPERIPHDLPLSPPAWEAWIETQLQCELGGFAESPPAWEAWIETGFVLPPGLGQLSPPAWEAWIETPIIC